MSLEPVVQWVLIVVQELCFKATYLSLYDWLIMSLDFPHSRHL